MGLSGQQSRYGRLAKGENFLPLLATYPQSIRRPACTLLPMSTKLARFQFEANILIFFDISVTVHHIYISKEDVPT